MIRGFTPTKRLAIAVAIAAPLWLLPSSVAPVHPAIMGVVILVLLIAIDVGTIPARGDVRVEREMPAAVGLGDESRGAHRLRTRSRRRTRAAIVDRLAPGLEITESLPRSDVPAEGAMVFPFAFRGTARGSHRLQPLAVVFTGSLGLVRRIDRFDLPGTVVVAPSLAGIRHYRLLAMQRRLRTAGIRTIRRRGESTAFDRLRPYARGDDPRHIDWKATARHRELITREYSIEQGQTVLLMVDAGRLMTQLVAGGTARFEYALQSALVLADIAAGAGDNVGLLVFDDAIRAWVAPARGHAAVRAIRDALIPVVPSLVEPDYAGAFRFLATKQRKRAMLVVFSDLVDPRGSHAFLANLARASQRHLPVVVALRNDELIELADGTPRADPWQRAAAEEILAERDVALGSLRRSGSAVLDVSPARMTAPVINRYLEMKERSLL